jgi:glycosyltransferase involved in cell wall biosynthesis
MRLAWFSPMPPVPSGIAACSAELVDALISRHAIDVYVHETAADQASGDTRPKSRGRVRSAHDFIWRHQAEPYDLQVYQIGNSSHHDYIWPYLFRYPGLTVLHDAHVHHARAASLLRTKRTGDFRREFGANQPDVSIDLAELAIAGLDNHLYYFSPMNRLVIEASRLTAVHTPPLARQLSDELPHVRVTAIRLAHGRLLSPAEIDRARKRVRTAYGIPDDAVVFGVFGGLAPDKRISQILSAIDTIVPYAPSVRLLLAGAPARHYDLAADVRQHGLDERVTITGYLQTEADLTDCIAASDVSLNLRWPTAREVSGPWLRALAAGRPTITIDLAHLVDVPSIDPRTWRMNHVAIRDSQFAVRADRTNDAAVSTDSKRESQTANPEPVTVAIDILDEDHSLRIAMRRLATDPKLRASLGAAGQRYWEREHSMPRMVEDYERVMAEAAALPAPRVALPSHLVNDGARVLDEVLTQFSLASVWDQKLETVRATPDESREGDVR